MVRIEYHRVQVLWLNGVFQSAEDHRPVAIADTVEQLQAWEAAQRAPEPYTEDHGEKRLYLVYRADSPIHYCNAPIWGCDPPWYRTVTEVNLENLSSMPYGVVNVGAT